MKLTMDCAQPWFLALMELMDGFWDQNRLHGDTFTAGLERLSRCARPKEVTWQAEDMRQLVSLFLIFKFTY